MAQFEENVKVTESSNYCTKTAHNIEANISDPTNQDYETLDTFIQTKVNPNIWINRPKDLPNQVKICKVKFLKALLNLWLLAIN